jgi:hypothetical protein
MVCVQTIRGLLGRTWLSFRLTKALRDSTSQWRHILETGNDSFRFKEGSAVAVAGKKSKGTNQKLNLD